MSRRKRDALDPEVAERVIERDGNACVHCFTTPAHIHHKKYRSRAKGDPMVNDERNLVMLCIDCHTRTHKEDPVMAKYRTASWQNVGESEADL